jgi:hypothetical protein
VRDDRPFAGEAAPAAVYFYSPDRGGEQPAAHLASFTGLLQADGYAGYVAPEFMLSSSKRTRNGKAAPGFCGT